MTLQGAYVCLCVHGRGGQRARERRGQLEQWTPRDGDKSGSEGCRANCGPKRGSDALEHPQHRASSHIVYETISWGDYLPCFIYGEAEVPCPGLHTVLSPLHGVASSEFGAEGPTRGS